MQTTVAELLNNYEGMKDILIDINPKFKKLNNPVLRRTLAKVATVKQAAIVGGMDADELLNKLRVAVGQTPLKTKQDIKVSKTEKEPDWIKTEPKETLDVGELLKNEINPLAVTFNKIRHYKGNELLLLISDFKPEPLIEEIEKKGFEVYCKEVNDKLFKTFIKGKQTP